MVNAFKKWAESGRWVCVCVFFLCLGIGIVPKVVEEEEELPIVGRAGRFFFCFFEGKKVIYCRGHVDAFLGSVDCK